MQIGEIIRIFRIANDYTISKLSEISGISASYLSEIEKGKKGKENSKKLYNNIEKIEKALQFNWKTTQFFKNWKLWFQAYIALRTNNDGPVIIKK